MLLKIYYAKSQPNAGDYFSVWILDKFGIKCLYQNKDVEAIICGSILGRNRHFSKNTKVLGAGLHNVDNTCIISPNNFYAVRGKLTENLLKLGRKVTLGDPGLLASYFYKPKTKKKYKFGIVSHYIDYEYFNQKYSKICPVINMETNNIESVLDRINECEFIFSSSLHGIIFSHSLGVPAIHIENKELMSKDNFKFKDYYSILDIPYIKEKADNLLEYKDKYLENKNNYCPNKELIQNIQKDLIKEFLRFKSTLPKK